MTKTKFKVGDEVRIVKNILESPSTKIGSVETVREVRPNKDRQYSVRLVLRRRIGIPTINDLKELFNSLPTKKPKVERGETMKKK